MSYHGAKFPRRLTWEWAKKQSLYCLSLISQKSLFSKNQPDFFYFPQEFTFFLLSEEGQNTIVFSHLKT